MGDLVFYSLVATIALVFYSPLSFLGAALGIVAGSYLGFRALSRFEMFPGLPFSLLLGVAGMLLIARYKLLYTDWRGYLVGFFALVWVANQYMSIYNRLRFDIKHEQVEIKADEKRVDEIKAPEPKVGDRKAA